MPILKSKISIVVGFVPVDWWTAPGNLFGHVARFHGYLSLRQMCSNWCVTNYASREESESHLAAPLVKEWNTLGACLSNKSLRHGLSINLIWFWYHLGMIWVWPWHDLGMTLAWFEYHLGMIWVSPWHDLGITLAWFGYHLGMIWVSLFNDTLVSWKFAFPIHSLIKFKISILHHLGIT